MELVVWTIRHPPLGRELLRLGPNVLRVQVEEDGI